MKWMQLLWMQLLWIVSLSLALPGCMQAKAIARYWQPEAPLTPYNAGYRDGCAVRKDPNAEHRYHRPVGGQFEADYSAGFSEGYALCSKDMLRGAASGSSASFSPTLFPTPSEDKDAHLPPYERYKDKKNLTKAQRDCVEKRRLCFPPTPD